MGEQSKVRLGRGRVWRGGQREWDGYIWDWLFSIDSISKSNATHYSVKYETKLGQGGFEFLEISFSILYSYFRFSFFTFLFFAGRRGRRGVFFLTCSAAVLHLWTWKWILSASKEKRVNGICVSVCV